MQKAMIIINVSDDYGINHDACVGCPYNGVDSCRLEELDVDFNCPQIIKEE